MRRRWPRRWARPRRPPRGRARGGGLLTEGGWLVTDGVGGRGQWVRPPARRVRAIRDRLRLVYGIPGWGAHGHPIAELVLTVLSQSTNDRNRDIAFLRLRQRFASWAQVRDAPIADVEAAIQPGGLHIQKSRRIVAMLQALPADLDLTYLRELPVPEAQAQLCALPGVGRK